MKSFNLTNKLEHRFQYFKWSLSLFKENLELRNGSLPLNKKTQKTKYPIRLLRYWWALSAIDDELKTLKSPVIADIGIDRAVFKRLLKPIPNAKIIGLDLAKNLEQNKEDLKLAHYDELLSCDLDICIPLPDSSVDILINLHVLEHLPRPEFTLSEFNRVLRPDGLLLLSFPVLPKPLAQLREKQFASQFKEGTRVSGNHRHAFWPRRAQHLIEKAGLNIEFMLGSYLIRKQGAFWENSALCMRLNQLWGTLFPSLGQELNIKIRKPAN